MAKANDSIRSLAALLRKHGFKGSAPTFRRFVGTDCVALVNVQASQGDVYVNLGVHYRWLGKPRSWENIKEYECAFRTRLVDFAEGQRFSLEDDASVTALLEMMKLEGLLFFAQLEPPQIAKTAALLARKGFSAFVPFDTPADAATWAKVAAHFEDTSSQVRFKAQHAAATEALRQERARQEQEQNAEAVEMTLAELRAAQKAGSAPRVVRLVFESETKKRAKRTTTKKSHPKKIPRRPAHA